MFIKSEVIKINQISLEPKICSLIQELERDLDCHHSIWENHDNINHLLSIGAKYNYINESLYEKVFGIKGKYKYKSSFYEERLDSFDFFSNTPDELKKNLQKISKSIEEIVNQLTHESYAPAFIFTSNHDSNRIRIPIHVHSNRSNSDLGNELCITVSVRLNQIPREMNSVLFYSKIDPENKSLLHEELLNSDDYIRLSLKDRISIFIFDGKTIPHTTYFTSDLMLWCVFNGAILKNKDICKDSITYLEK